MKYSLENIVTTVIGLVLVSIIVFLVIKNNKQKSTIKALKTYVISKDSIIRVNDSTYTKLVNDTKSQKQLLTQLKSENKSLSTKLKKDNSKVVSITKLVTVPNDQTNEVVVRVKDSTNLEFTDYYPDSTNTFITYSGIYKDDKLLGSWKFDKIDLSLTVVEKLGGLYEVVTQVPEWLNVSNVSVNSLPIIQEEDNFDWVTGIDLNTNTKLDKFRVGASGGLRLHNSLILLRANSDATFGAGYYKLF